MAIYDNIFAIFLRNVQMYSFHKIQRWILGICFISWITHVQSTLGTGMFCDVFLLFAFVLIFLKGILYRYRILFKNLSIFNYELYKIFCLSSIVKFSVKYVI